MSPTEKSAPPSQQTQEHCDARLNMTLNTVNTFNIKVCGFYLYYYSKQPIRNQIAVEQLTDEGTTKK
jgi:hypothetical protein